MHYLLLVYRSFVTVLRYVTNVHTCIHCPTFITDPLPTFTCTCMICTQALPAIKQYMESPEFIKRPINNPIAQWK